MSQILALLSIYSRGVSNKGTLLSRPSSCASLSMKIVAIGSWTCMRLTKEKCTRKFAIGEAAPLARACIWSKLSDINRLAIQTLALWWFRRRIRIKAKKRFVWARQTYAMWRSSPSPSVVFSNPSQASSKVSLRLAAAALRRTRSSSHLWK